MGKLESIKAFLKKIDSTTVKQASNSKPISSSGESVDKLDKNGELPFGWIANTKDFTNKIENEYRYFFNTWLDSRNKSPKEEYSSLKSFIIFLEDTEKLCTSMGECYEYWFQRILISPDYIENRKSELKNLVTNLEKLQYDFEKKQLLLINLPSTLYEFLLSNDGIMQKDIYNHFDTLIQPNIQSILFQWEKEGRIIREKTGRSYKIFLK